MELDVRDKRDFARVEFKDEFRAHIPYCTCAGSESPWWAHSMRVYSLARSDCQGEYSVSISYTPCAGDNLLYRRWLPWFCSNVISVYVEVSKISERIISWPIQRIHIKEKRQWNLNDLVFIEMYKPARIDAGTAPWKRPYTLIIKWHKYHKHSSAFG